MQEAGKREQGVKDQKNEIAELIRQIQRLKTELEILTKQVSISQSPGPNTEQAKNILKATTC